MKKPKRLLSLILILILLSGCAKRKTEIVLTTDFEENEVFRIDDSSCMKNEVMVYLVNSENSYDILFGPGIWKTKLPVKESSLSASAGAQANPDNKISVSMDNSSPSEITVEEKYKEI